MNYQSEILWQKRGISTKRQPNMLLKGTFLDLFAKNHTLIYKDIALSDLKTYDCFYMTNAVRGLVEIKIDGIS